MGALAGFIGGLGLTAVLLACWAPAPRAAARATSGERRQGRTATLLSQAGIARLTPATLLAASLGAGVLAAAMTAAATGSRVVAACFGTFVLLAPRSVVASKARKRQRAMREVWPEIVDQLLSGVRAGLSLPEAVAELADNGPAVTASAFAAFAAENRATGMFGPSLTSLKERLANPTADRIIEALRLTQEVGGRDLGRLLSTLGGFLRDDARIRGELEARQTWTVNGARLAAGAPWLVLALISTRPQSASAFDSSAGAFVLAAGAALSFVAFRVMIRIGRLPEERRWLA